MQGVLYVAKIADLGTGRNEISALQRHDLDLLLHREIFRPPVWTAQVGNGGKIVEHTRGSNEDFQKK
jgi:hypothetical protein